MAESTRLSLHRERPLFVFDGHCVLCSSGASFIMRHDREGRIQFMSAQSELGQRLYEQIGQPIDHSYLLVDSSGVHTKSAGYFRVARLLGGWWRLAEVFHLIPPFLRDWIYDCVAANRYRWFGKTDQCVLLSADQRTRLVVEDPELAAQLD